jgi:hypothetical protein
LFPLLIVASVTAFLLLPLSPLHDLVLPVATMIHSRAQPRTPMHHLMIMVSYVRARPWLNGI